MLLAKKLDPSGTAMIRRAFMADMQRRIKSIVNSIVDMVVTEDCFGLSSPTHIVVANAQQQFKFATNDRRQAAFQRWFKDLVDQKLLGVDKGVDPDKPWTTKYVTSAYKKGVVSGYTKTVKSGKVKGVAEGKKQFLQNSFGSPVAMQSIQMLATRSFEQLKGISAAMSAKISRDLALGFAQGQNPRQIASTLSKSVTDLGKQRALTLARTEVIHAAAEGQLDSFDNLGVDEVGIEAEWSTAGDDRVCPYCQARAGQVYTVKQARGLIPLHPNCRCAWIPAIEGKSPKRIKQQKLFDKIAQKKAKDSTLPDNLASLTQKLSASPAPVIRTLGKHGFSFDEVKRAFADANIPIADATIRTQLSAGKSGKRGEGAALTDEEWNHFRSFQKGGATPAPQPPTPPPYVPPKPPTPVPTPTPPKFAPPVTTGRTQKEILEERSKVYAEWNKAASPEERAERWKKVLELDKEYRKAVDRQRKEQQKYQAEQEKNRNAEAIAKFGTSRVSLKSEDGTEVYKTESMQKVIKDHMGYFESFPKLHKFAQEGHRLSVELTPGNRVKNSAGKATNADGMFHPGVNRMQVAYGKGETYVAPPTLGPGAWTVGGNSFESVFRHEYGHHVHFNMIGINTPAGKDWEAISRHYYKNGSGYDGTIPISRYAATDTYEVFAESFNAYTNPKYVRGSLPKDIEKYLDKHLKGEEQK